MIIKDLILEDVSNKRDVLFNNASYLGSKELGVLAKFLLNDAYSFLKDLFEFMTTEVNAMNKQRRDETEHANWVFVSHVVREIFKELHNVRQYAEGDTPA